MKKYLSQLLPPSLFGKIIAILGYLIAVLGILMTFFYYQTAGSTCQSLGTDLSDIRKFALLFGTAQLVVVLGTIFVILGLKKYTGMLYITVAILILCTILIAQLLVAMGWSFAVGTACSTY